MSAKFYDVIVAKDYVVKNNGVDEKRTAWNKVGRAWISQTGESLSFEMFFMPNQKYVIQLKPKESTESKNKDVTPF